MDFKAEQDRLDKIKWDDSMREGRKGQMRNVRFLRLL